MARTVHTLLVVLLLTAPLQGCLSGDVPFVGGDTSDDDGGEDPGDGEDQTDDGDDGSDPEIPPLPPLDFNGTRAYSHVRDQVRWDNGTTQYRVPGSTGASEARREIAEALDRQQWEFGLQRWTGTYRCEETEMVNIEATLPGHTNKLLILGAHYDTRPWSDNSYDVENWTESVPGANDGGSGVGALLELARVLGDHRPLNYTVKLVFFDAEDGGNPPDTYSDCNPDEHPGHNTPGGWIIGSSHYVAEMGREKRNNTEAVIILDMVGDENLTLKREEYSSYSKPADNGALQDRIWSNAARLNVTQFNDTYGPRILDDHRPFQRVGIKAVDIIHLDDEGRGAFPESWHTTEDTLDRISPESLEAVGRVTEYTVFQMDRALGVQEQRS